MQVSDNMGAFENIELTLKEGIRWVHDNLIAFVDRVWGGNHMQMEEGVLMKRSRNDRGKTLHMKLVRDEYKALGELDMRAEDRSPILTEIMIPAERRGLGWIWVAKGLRRSMDL